MKTWLTSNLYIGRTEIFFERGFASQTEMHEYIIENWNSQVQNDDEVYILGNFAWDPITAQDFLSSVNGKIYLMIGEYDDAAIEIVNSFENFDIILDQIYIYEKVNSVISYWPLQEWPEMETGSYHFYGRGNHKNDLLNSQKINVSFDTWEQNIVDVDNIKNFIVELQKQTEDERSRNDN